MTAQTTPAVDDKEAFDNFARSESIWLGKLLEGHHYDKEGGSVVLYTTSKTTEEQISKAEREARSLWDVTDFDTRRIPDEWVERVADNSQPTISDTNPSKLYESAKYILEHGARKIDGNNGELVPENKHRKGSMLMDTFTASMFVQVFDMTVKFSTDETKSEKARDGARKLLHIFATKPPMVAITYGWRMAGGKKK